MCLRGGGQGLLQGNVWRFMAEVHMQGVQASLLEEFQCFIL